MIELEIPGTYFDESMSNSADIFCTQGKFSKDAVCCYMEKKGLLKDLETFARTHVDKRWLLTFKNETALKQLSAFSPFKSKGSWYVVSSASIAEYTIRIHHLASSVSNEAVSKALQPKVEKVLKVTREEVRDKFGKNRVVRNVTVDMFSHQLAKLPHKMEIQTHEALVNVIDSRGRLGKDQRRCFTKIRGQSDQMPSTGKENTKKAELSLTRSLSPFCIWPQFGAFIDIKRKRPIVDLRWTLPKFFATHLDIGTT